MGMTNISGVDPAGWRNHFFGLSRARWQSLAGKHVLITGAGTGYGQAIACALAVAGCNVYLTGRRLQKLKDTLELVQSYGGPRENCRIVDADITAPEQISDLVKRVSFYCGELHGLINNAALAGPSLDNPLLEAGPDDWEKIISTNVKAPWALSNALMPLLISSGHVRIINMISGAAWAGTPGYGLYNVSKAALSSLTYSAALESRQAFPEADVQINALDPGEARTEMNQGSGDSPFKIVPMTLLLLSTGNGGPNGNFFHSDGRHLTWGLSAPYATPLENVPNAETQFLMRFEQIQASKSQMLSQGIDHKTVQTTSYPYKVPSPHFSSGLDMILLELPPRYMPMMPNGVGYVHNMLKSIGIRFQTYDYNISFYHHYHEQRLKKSAHSTQPILSGDVPLDDPWDNTQQSLWQDDDFIGSITPQIDEVVAELVKAAPRLLGLSLNGLNLKVAEKVVRGVRAALPDIQVIVGGHSCVYHLVGPHQFPHFDYMCIGEAELTLPNLIRDLLAGESPKDLPGIIAKHDSVGRQWVPAPLPRDLDSNGFPRYDWNDIKIYRDYKGYALVPILSSRGCCWGKCSFCAERFSYRSRTPKLVVDEIEWFSRQGFKDFHFNESDLNGDIKNISAVCEGIIRRNLHVNLVGQLRIDRRNNADFFRLLRVAGFGYLRFGVDGWSDHTLRLQKKGYTMEMVAQNLKDCAAPGVAIAVNIVIGVPGETEEDIDVSIENIIKNKKYISSVDNINTLILSHGSDYYNDPEKYNIKFRGDREVLYAENVEAIPHQLWYSDAPYIDQDVRIARMQRVYNALKNEGISVGNFAECVVKKINDDVVPVCN